MITKVLPSELLTSRVSKCVPGSVHCSIYRLMTGLLIAFLTTDRWWSHHLTIPYWHRSSKHWAKITQFEANLSHRISYVCVCEWTFTSDVICNVYGLLGPDKRYILVMGETKPFRSNWTNCFTKWFSFEALETPHTSDACWSKVCKCNKNNF